MIDHINLSVGDFEVSRSFLREGSPTAWISHPSDARSRGRGDGSGVPNFWIGVTDEPTTAHVAFRADGRLQVDAFHTVPLPPEASTMAALGFGPLTTRSTTARSSSTRIGGTEH